MVRGWDGAVVTALHPYTENNLKVVNISSN